MYLERIKYFCEDRKYPRGLTGLAEDIGMSVANIHRCVKDGNMQMAAIEKIARCLKVPVSVFFDDDVSEKAFEKVSNEQKVVEMVKGSQKKEHEDLKLRVQRLEQTSDAIVRAIKKLSVQFETPSDY